MAAIESVLENASETRELFHEESAPFNTFKARIVAGKAFGFFGAEVAKDLNIIRDIRNQFAHALLRVNFKNEDIVAECKRLGDYEESDVRKRRVSEARAKYENACYSLGYQLTKVAAKNLLKKLRIAKGGLIPSGFQSREYDVRRDGLVDKL